MYLEWLDQMISIDPLTRLNNRKQLVYHYEQWAKNGDSAAPLYLLLVDANKFKSINDTYGHIQGDAALVRIAEALRLGARSFQHRVNIARYGGDAFVILANADDAAQIDALRDNIDEARADPALSLKELIERAYKQLYEEKERRHKAAVQV
ncbi:MAG: GGDEF domain-containing protein [Clostridia bacterium]|nr:GGDEF domain-containing protein [Clostridia bacterium]